MSWRDLMSVRLHNTLSAYAQELGMDPDSEQFVANLALELRRNGHRNITNLGRKSMEELMRHLRIPKPVNCPTCNRPMP